VRRLGLLLLVCLVACGGPEPAPEPASQTPVAQPSAEPSTPEEPVVIRRSWRKVVIDAGHGGEDTGATGVSGIAEKDLTLSIALASARSLRSRGFEVVLTRQDDVTLPLARRSGLGNASGAGLFVSVHANSAPAPQAWGLETYSMDLASDEAALRLAERENREAMVAGGDPRDADAVDAIVSELRMSAQAERSAELAGAVHTAMVDGLTDFYGADRVRDRGARTAPFWVLVDSEVPAILLEVGYLSNEDEERRVRTRGYHHQLAEALAAGIEVFVTRVEQAEGSSAPEGAEGAEAIAPGEGEAGG
jgi:N-acetylmuramoyl-L-alanine amidase